MKQVLILLLLISLSVSAQKSNYAKIENYMDKQAQYNRFGGTVLVMKNDSVILKKAYGKANYEWDINTTVDTKFILASITKHMTAIAVMQLVENGKLSLTDKLDKFFPTYPKGDKVTIHMLLTHTAGLALDYDDLYMNSTSISKDSAINIIRNRPYIFEPGTNCKYSNIGYFLLSQIVESASGLSFDWYLRDNVFKKAGMINSGVSNNDSIVAKKASIYYREGKGYALNPFINWNLNVGLDGIYSTVEDLYKLDRAQYDETLLSTASKKLMETQYNKKYPDGGFIDSYGYGIFINPYYNHGHHLLTHSGGFIGTMTTFDRYPKDNIFIAVLSNNESESHMIGYGLAGILFNKTVDLPYLHVPFEVDPKTLSQFTGTFEGIEITTEDGILYARNPDNFALVAESKNKFYKKTNPDRTYEFVLDKKGSVTGMIISKGGVHELKKKSKQKS